LLLVNTILFSHEINVSFLNQSREYSLKKECTQQVSSNYYVTAKDYSHHIEGVVSQRDHVYAELIAKHWSLVEDLTYRYLS
jgi:hypothetical protein